MPMNSTQPHLPGLAEARALYVPEPPVAVGQARVSYVQTREILTKATGFMDAYDFTLNPYAGCSFGCTYCYAAFFGRTRQDLDSWGNWVKVKENAIDLLKQRKSGTLDEKLIYMSSVTDPYQPIERKLNLTRRLLEVLAERHKPKLVVQTRSPDVVRDCDIFRQIEDQYPDTPAASQAAAILPELREAVAYGDYAALTDSLKAASSDAEAIRALIPRFEQVWRQFPHTSSGIAARANIGVCHQKLGEWQRAVDVFDAILSAAQADSSLLAPNIRAFVERRRATIARKHL